VRRVLPFAILTGCLAVGVLPAFAADTTVSAGPNSWDPRDFAVKPGEQVTWANASGVVHNLYIDGAQVQPNGSAWTYGPQSFAARATAYSFRCQIHAGMSGRFFVNDSGTVPTPSPTASPSPTQSPGASPTATTSPGGGGAGGGGGGSPAAPGSTTAPVSSFRVRVSRRGARIFLTLTIRAREPVRVRGTLRRGKRRVRSVTLLGRPGRHRVRLPGRALKPGRYALTLRAGRLTRVVRFTVRAS